MKYLNQLDALGGLLFFVQLIRLGGYYLGYFNLTSSRVNTSWFILVICIFVMVAGRLMVNRAKGADAGARE